MNKDDKFAALDNVEHFTASDAITAFTSNEDPKRVGRRTLTNLAQIDLTQITTEENVRTQYDEAKHLELVAQLEAMGQLQPIVVWWSDEKSKYVVFMGHRRFRAAPVAGMTSLQCVILSQPPTEAERIEKQLAENEGREEINPMDLARGFAQIKAIRECSERELATSFGVSRSEMKRLLSLTTLPEEIQAAVSDGSLPKSVAAKIAESPSAEEQLQAYADYQNGATIDDIADAVRKTPKASGPKGGASSGRKPEKFVDRETGITVTVTAKRKSTTLAEMEIALKKAAKELAQRSRTRTAA